MVPFSCRGQPAGNRLTESKTTSFLRLIRAGRIWKGQSSVSFESPQFFLNDLGIIHFHYLGIFLLFLARHPAIGMHDEQKYGLRNTKSCPPRPHALSSLHIHNLFSGSTMKFAWRKNHNNGTTSLFYSAFET